MIYYQLLFAKGELGCFVCDNLFNGVIGEEVDESPLLLGESVFLFRGELVLVDFEGESLLLEAKAKSHFFVGELVRVFFGDLFGDSVFLAAT